LHGQDLSLVPALPLDFVFRHCYVVAVADLAQLLRNHAAPRHSGESLSSNQAKGCIYRIFDSAMLSAVD
jgi:hypothetical protein